MANLAHISFAGVDSVARNRVLGVKACAAGAQAETSVSREGAKDASEEPLDPLMAWMLERAGLQPTAYRPAAMQRRVSACLRQLRVTTTDSARELLERKPEMLPFALNTVLIGVSEFFRDRHVFDYLKHHVLPELLQTREGLRVCSAGSSGGQELYSAAMLLAEAGVLEQCELLGVDCRSDAIKRAVRGIYSAEDMSAVEPARCRRFFQETGARWAVLPVLKKQIQWREADILSFKADAPFDLILFRNVSIYLNETHSIEAWVRLCDQLVPGGFLITGKAERPPAALPLARVAPSIYRKNQS